jgi:hypothetical protein
VAIIMVGMFGHAFVGIFFTIATFDHGFIGREIVVVSVFIGGGGCLLCQKLLKVSTWNL